MINTSRMPSGKGVGGEKQGRRVGGGVVRVWDCGGLVEWAVMVPGVLTLC